MSFLHSEITKRTSTTTACKADRVTHGHCPNKDCAQPGQACLQDKAKGFLTCMCPGQLLTDGVSALHISTGCIWKQSLLCNVKRFVHQENSPGELCKWCKTSPGSTHHFCLLPSSSFQEKINLPLKVQGIT